MDRKQIVFDYLGRYALRYDYYEHPAAPTIELARLYWRDDGSKHCKNLFFRNHKGDRHYLVVFDCDRNLAIRDLERRLRQESSRSLPNSGWNGIWDSVRVPYRRSD